MKIPSVNTSTLVTVTLGVMAAGALMYFGRNLPGIKQARRGFDV